MPKNFTLQVSGDYQSKTIFPPGGSGGGGGGGRGPGGGGGGMFGSPERFSGLYSSNYGMDMALRFDFMKEKRASIYCEFQ